METEFKRMTDFEIARYVFRPTPDFEIIKKVALTYIDFYKLAGADAAAVMKFAGGCGRAIISDNPNKTVISPGGSGTNNVISVVDNAMIESLKRDIRAALAEKKDDDIRRYTYEKREIKYNKKLNRKERREEKKADKAYEKFYKKYGYYPDDEEELETTFSASNPTEDNSDLAEQEAEEASRQAMYAQYEQITAEKEQPTKEPLTPLNSETETKTQETKEPKALQSAPEITNPPQEKPKVKLYFK